MQSLTCRTPRSRISYARIAIQLASRPSKRSTFISRPAAVGTMARLDMARIGSRNGRADTTAAGGGAARRRKAITVPEGGKQWTGSSKAPSIERC